MLVDRCGYRLAEAKLLVDRVLEGEEVPVEFDVFTDDDARALHEIGVLYRDAQEDDRG